ncbi:immune-associated nucleotide-binding protein 12 [Elysia marginata]|uniref:Immune-associated nucleotide-binding protein 12 n=1 Tax=Elysia marginata TaxID=1093978 RepID=A0AAV4GWQ5_9GAST|nr:immune-associated nucleotide-binding protein 12 [Elysia marginata]
MPGRTYRRGGGVLLEYIQVLAALTVRLRVHHVSGNRPNGYTFSGFRNLDLRHLGTGWVYRVTRGDGPCPCGKCPVNIQSTTTWWKIEIFTACHVVYDQREAKSTEADLFYDSDESSAFTTLYGHDVEDNSQQDDVCVLLCISHDHELVRQLMDAVERYELLKWDVKESVMSTLCVVVSHPHGMPKKVTVGEIVSKAKYDPEQSMMTEFMYTYSAETCKGSSGAPVLTVVTRKALGATGVWPGAGPHSGHLEGALNQCGSGSFYVGADVLNRTMLQDSLEKLKTATTYADVNFILIGKTGVGKSALGNSILKKKVFSASPSVESVTRHTEFAISQFDGKIIKVVDMLGVGDTRFSIVESTNLFLEQLNETISVSAGGSHVFLLVFRFGTRFTLEDRDTILILKNVLGNDFVRYSCILVMTHGDSFFELDWEERMSFSEWCRAQRGPFRELVDECEDRVLLFDNLTKDESVQNKQIADLFQAVNVLRTKERNYTAMDYALNTTTREKILIEMKEPEVREKVLQEEATLLRELRRKKSDTQALKVLFMRAESLMRYVQAEDRETGSLRHLVQRVATLRRTVEDSFRAQNSVMDWMTQTMVKEIMAEEEIRLQQEWFGGQLSQMDATYTSGFGIAKQNPDVRR